MGPSQLAVSSLDGGFPWGLASSSWGSWPGARGLAPSRMGAAGRGPAPPTQVSSWHRLGDSEADEGDLAERAGIRLCTCKCSDLVQGRVFAEPQLLGILWFLCLTLGLAYLWNHTLRAWS